MHRIELKEKIKYLVPPFFIFSILSIIFIINKLYPFGINTLAWCDMKQQVIPLLLQWKEILSGNQSILFQMYNAGGSNFWGIFFFFLSSPFSFFIVFIDKSDSVVMMNFIIAAKIALASLTAMIMFSRIFPNVKTIFCIGLSVAYALSGFPLMFFQNLIWLDLVYLFPLLIIGIHNLIYKNKTPLFCISLTLIFIVNYYMSFMVILFLIFAFGIMMYSPIKSIIDKRNDKSLKSNDIYIKSADAVANKKKVIGLFIYSSLLCAILSCFVWLPSFIQYLKSARVISFIEKLSSGYFFAYYETTASILMTTSMFFMIFIFINIYIVKIPLPSKLLPMFALLILPIFIEPINKMWHAGSYQAFPARYGYITTIIGLMILAYFYSITPFMTKVKSTSKENLLTKNRIVLALGCVLMTLAACVYSIYIIIIEKDSIDEFTTTLWNDRTAFLLLLRIALVFGITHIILFLVTYYKKLNTNLFIACFCLLLIFESFFNLNVFVGFSANDPKYYNPIFDLEDKISDDEIFRVKTDEKYFDVSLLGGLGYNTLNTYTSLTSERYLFVMKKLGFSSYWMEINSTQGSLFSDALMANKYEIVKNYFNSNENEIIYQNEDYKIKKNQLNMKLASVVSIPDLKKFVSMPDGNRFEIQNKLFEFIFNTGEKLFTEYPEKELTNIDIRDDKSMRIINNSEEAIIHYSLHVTGKAVLYFDCFDKVTNNLVEKINDSFRVTVNGVQIQGSYPNKEVNGLLSLGEFEDEFVNVDLILLKNVAASSLGIASLDISLLKSNVDDFSIENLSTTIEQHKNKFMINATVSDQPDPYLLLTIPYDEGFKATSNGKPVNIEKLLSGLMAVKLAPGVNDIELIFFPQGLLCGIIISVIGGISFILLFIKRRYFIGTKIFRRILSVTYNIYFIFYVITFIAVYIFPIIVYTVINYLQ